MKNYFNNFLLILLIVIFGANVFLDYSLAYDRGYNAGLDYSIRSLDSTFKRVTLKNQKTDTIILKNVAWQLKRK